MAALFSLPVYPGAVSYNVVYSDPTSGDPNGQNPLGPWNPITGSPLTTTSNIIDSSGNQELRLYRAAPTVTINGSPFTFNYYEPFSVAMSATGVFKGQLYDPQITIMLPQFRKFIGDDGIQQVASTAINLDTGAGSGLLQPDGTTTTFNLADVPDSQPAIVLEGSVVVVKNGATLVNNTDYYVIYDAGQVVFATAPLANATLTITFKEVRYTNKVLNAALANALERLPGLGINGYGTQFDNNVVLASSPIGNDGLRYIIYLAAQKILNQAVIWAKAQSARAYKTGDFSMDTAPSRILDGMSNQTKIDFSELKDATDKYIRTATRGISFGDYDSFLSLSGLLPSWSALYLLNPYAYWI